MKNSNKGFGILEVLVVMAVVVILAGLSYPRYDAQLKRSKRSEGQAFLTDVAARQARYFSQNNRYVTDSKELVNLYGYPFNGGQSANGYYVLQLAPGKAEDGGYRLTALQQFVDSRCGSLTLNALGVKGHSGSENQVEQCWR